MSLEEPSQVPIEKSGEYVVVARRYRPQAFGELVGQGMVSQALKNAINTDRIGHAYLFTGARGVGKTSTARIFAKALNCTNGPTPDPCGQCDICLSITSGEDVDVLEIDGASNRGIDEIRQLRSNVGIRPSRSQFKVYIIDEVHMLTKEAFNALLKTLEEPPDHVKFIFCTTEPGKIPITVLSRCQRFDFSPVDSSEIAERLRFIVESEGAQAESEALELLSRKAAGSMRDSQSLLEQLLSFVGDNIRVEDVHAMFGTAKTERVTAVIEQLIARDPNGTLSELQNTLCQGVDAGQLAEQLLTSLRDIMACAVGCDASLLLFHSPSEADRLAEHGKKWGVETLLAAIQILDQAVTRMRMSVHSRILLEVALVRIAKLDDLDELSDVISKIASGQPLEIATSKKKSVANAEARPQADRATAPTPNPVPAAATTSDQTEQPSRAVSNKNVEDVEPAVPNASETSPATKPTAPVDPSTESTSNAPQQPVQSDSVQNEPVKTEPAADSLRDDSPAKSKPVTDSNVAAASKEEGDIGAHNMVDESQAASESTTSEPSNPDEPSNTSESSSPVNEVAASTETEVAAPVRQSATPSGDSAAAESGQEDESPIPAPIIKLPMKPENANQIWQAAIDQLTDLTADFARQASRIAISAPNQLAVYFLSRYNSGRVYCERPERRQKLEAAIANVVDQVVKIEFFTVNEDGAHEAPKKPNVSSQQLKREITSHPLVEFATKLFEAQVTKVDVKKQ